MSARSAIAPPSFATAFEALCLQAAGNGREAVFFGDCLGRVRKEAAPFLVGEKFPSIYLEFPLLGDPFLDVTLLYNKIAPGTRIDSPAAAGAEDMLDWFAGICDGYDDIACGFELDTSKDVLPVGAVHFQPRSHTELVEPFCAAVGEPERAALYLDLYKRMPDGWKPSFFGMFRGRPGSPLRVCGYLGGVKAACAEHPRRMVEVFDHIGFTAYDGAMIERMAELMQASPKSLDYQIDIYPDGSLGSIFALDIQFELETTEAVHESLDGGPGGRALELLESWGIADERWRLISDSAFARSIPVAQADGTEGRYSFVLMPGWAKVRWVNGVLQPSKFYYFAHAGILDE